MCQRLDGDGVAGVERQLDACAHRRIGGKQGPVRRVDGREQGHVGQIEVHRQHRVRRHAVPAQLLPESLDARGRVGRAAHQPQPDQAAAPRHGAMLGHGRRCPCSRWRRDRRCGRVEAVQRGGHVWVCGGGTDGGAAGHARVRGGVAEARVKDAEVGDGRVGVARVRHVLDAAQLEGPLEQRTVKHQRLVLAALAAGMHAIAAVEIHKRGVHV